MISSEQERTMLSKAVAVYAKTFQDEALSSSRVDAAIKAMRAAHAEMRRQENELLAHDLNGLSKREIEVVDLLSEGLVVKEVGTRLDLGYSTVRTHIHAAFKKLGVNDRGQLVAIYLRNRDALYPPE